MLGCVSGTPRKFAKSSRPLFVPVGRSADRLDLKGFLLQENVAEAKNNKEANRLAEGRKRARGNDSPSTWAALGFQRIVDHNKKHVEEDSVLDTCWGAPDRDERRARRPAKISRRRRYHALRLNGAQRADPPTKTGGRPKDDDAPEAPSSFGIGRRRHRGFSGQADSTGSASPPS